MLSKAASSTIFWVFGMTRHGIEPWSPGPLANTLLIRPMARPYETIFDAIRRDSVSFFEFPISSYVQVFTCKISLVRRLRYPPSCFSSHFCFVVIAILLIFMLIVLFLVAIISLFISILCSQRVFVLLHLHIWRLLFLLFLIHIVCQCHHFDV